MTGALMALLLGTYALTGSVFVITVIAADYLLRSLPSVKYSPGSWIARILTHRFPSKEINKGPKLFAARVGFLFAVSSLICFFISPGLSIGIALSLMGFALLESIGDICVGCWVYTYVMIPLLESRQ